MKYDFDEEIIRKGTNSVKWEFIHDGNSLRHWNEPENVSPETRLLPLWVADMDFPCPEPVVQALVARAQHGIFGYTATTSSYENAVTRWMKKRHGWEISPEWICTTPGVVPAINMLLDTCITPGEKVIIQPPVYHPFRRAIENNGGAVVNNPLIYEDGSYRMDFEDLEQKTSDPKVRMAILCNPHNPVGRVWTREELLRFGEICLKNNVLVVSDEIHGDLILEGYVFTPFASLNDEFAQGSVTCTAPSKTFNIAGLKTSNILFPDDQLHDRFKKTLGKTGVRGLNPFGLVALEAAYNHGEEWLEQVLDYIKGNYEYLQDYIGEHLPMIRVVPLEGTYLVWLDCNELGLSQSELRKAILKDARVFLVEGETFGEEGEGFQRVNIACPRSILIEALDRLRNIIETRQHQ